MGRHDVAHVAWAVAQIHDLPQRRLGDFQPRAHHEVEQMSEPLRLVDILDAKTSVDENQPVVALDQEAVAAHRRRRQQRGRSRARAGETRGGARGRRPPPAPPNSLPPGGRTVVSDAGEPTIVAALDMAASGAVRQAVIAPITRRSTLDMLAFARS